MESILVESFRRSNLAQACLFIFTISCWNPVFLWWERAKQSKCSWSRDQAATKQQGGGEEDIQGQRAVVLTGTHGEKLGFLGLSSEFLDAGGGDGNSLKPSQSENAAQNLPICRDH